MSIQVNNQEKIEMKDVISWLLVFGLPAVLWFIPLNLDPMIQRFLAISLWGVLSWMTAIIPVEATGIALPCFFVLFGVLPGDVAFSPWGNTIIWATVGSILIGVAADKSGIARRMAYSILLRMDCSLKGLVWGFSIAGIILALVISDSFARAVIFITIAVGICRALEIPFKSKEATALGMAAFFGMSGPSIMTLTGGNGIQLNSVYRNVVGNMDWFQWLLHNWLPGLLWTFLGVFCILAVIRLGNGRCFDAREELEARKAELGKLSLREYFVFGALILLVLNYIFAGNFGLDPFLMPAVAIPFFFLPKIGILTAGDFDGADFKILFVMTGALTVGAGANAIGLVDMLIAMLGPVIGSSSVMMVYGTFVFSTFANFLLTPLAIIFTFSEAIAQMAVTLGFNPLPMMYALNFGTDVYIFPYEFAILLLCFSFGLMDYKDTLKILGLRFLGAFVIMAICIPYWYLCGIM